MQKRALVTGVNGQDGAYLAKYLVEKGYRVRGTSRDATASTFTNLTKLAVLDKVELASLNPTEFSSVAKQISEFDPHEIYNLSGQSSVGLSFDQPVETLQSITTASFHFLEAVKFLNPDIKYYNASSSECFGKTTEQNPGNERTAFNPTSPYGVAKAAAFWQVRNYREGHGLFACSGILFNHESPLRPSRFVTQKVIRRAVEIASGKSSNLEIGNISVVRDWGWAPDYVKAMHAMLQAEQPADYVIATGVSHSLEDFIRISFQKLGLDWKEWTTFDKTLFRKSELDTSYADPSKARRLLGWNTEVSFEKLVENLIQAELEAQKLSN